MANDPKQEAVERITKAWEEAQEQLTELRAAVEQHTQLAQAKLDQGFMKREREKALAELGEVVWSLIQKGKLQTSDAMKPALKMVELAEAKAAAQQSQIGDLLRETDVLASERRSSSKQTLASKTKKR